MSYKTLNNINNFSNNEDGGSTGKLQYYQACTNDTKPSPYTSSTKPGWPGGYIKGENDNLNGLFCVGGGHSQQAAISDEDAPTGTRYSDYTDALQSVPHGSTDFFCANDGTPAAPPGCYLGFKCTPQIHPGVSGGVDLWPKTLQNLQDYENEKAHICLISQQQPPAGVDKVKYAYDQCVNEKCVITKPPHTHYPAGDPRIPRCAVSGGTRAFSAPKLAPGMWSGEGARCTKHRQPDKTIACHCGKDNRQWMCARSHPNVPNNSPNAVSPKPGTTPLFGQNAGNGECAIAGTGGDIGTNWNKFYSNPPAAAGGAVTEKTCADPKSNINLGGQKWCARAGKVDGGPYGGGKWWQPASTPWMYGLYKPSEPHYPGFPPGSFAGPICSDGVTGMWCPGGACSKPGDPTLYPSVQKNRRHMWPPTYPYPFCGPSVPPGSS